MAGHDEIIPSTPPHLTSGAGTLTGKWLAAGQRYHGGTWGHRPLNQFFNHRLPTWGASHAGDAMTSGQQSPHGGAPNGG